MITLHLPALRRGKTAILPACTLTLQPGEVVGVVGPNGAGKTTLLSAIAGLAPEKVRITQNGTEVPRTQIGYLPQAFTVRSQLTVMDCILLGRRETLGLRVPASIIAEAETLLATSGLSDLADRAMQDLSGGQQQRVLIAQRLFRTPKLLILDEPTSALDLHHQLDVMHRLHDHAKTAQIPMIAAIHDLTLAARFCSRILVLAKGNILADAPPSTALSATRLAQNWQIHPEILTSSTGFAVIVPHLHPNGQRP